MKFTSTFLILACAGWAQAAPSAPQEPVKIPRPLPVMIDDKGPAELGLVSRPASIAHHAAPDARASSKSRPAGAPAVLQFHDGLERVLVSEPGDGRVWVRGADYKASFGADGTTFIPFLGSDAPRNYPVRLTLSSARVAGVALPFAEIGVVRRDGERVVIDHGDIDEVYDLALRSLEQTFVIDSLATRGALSIDVAVESELAGVQVGDGIEFANERGGVRYGKMVVLDDAGARFEGAAQFIDGRIRLEVPASFVRAARLPLRVDPVVTTFAVVVAPLYQYYSDIAFDLSNDRWCAVYEDAYSATDHDVYARLFDSSGVFTGIVATVDYTADFWAQPKIANNNLADNFLVVASVVPVAGGLSFVKACTVTAAGGIVGTQTVISAPGPGSEVWVDVGGDPSLVAPTYYCVVWERDYITNDADIHARLVSSGGVPIGTSSILIDNSFATLDMQPRISKSDGAPPASTQEWNIVWTRVNPSTSRGDIYGAQVHWDGIITAPSFLIDGSPDDDRAPVASSPLDRASGQRPWLVAYTRLNAGQTDLYGQVFQGSSSQATCPLTYLDGVNQSENQISPEVDTDGVQFVVAFAEEWQGSGIDYDLYASVYCYADQVLSLSERMGLDVTGSYIFTPRIAAKHSSGGLARSFGVTWTAQPQATVELEILGALLNTPYDAPAEVYCPGNGIGAVCPCGNFGTGANGCAHSANANGASFGGSGFHHVSNDHLVLTASGMPATTACLLFQGTVSASLPLGDGMLCVGGSILRLGVKFASGGAATFPGAGDPALSQQGLLGVNGGRRYYQGWFRDAAVYCTAATNNLTNGYSVVWLP